MCTWLEALARARLRVSRIAPILPSADRRSRLRGRLRPRCRISEVSAPGCRQPLHVFARQSTILAVSRFPHLRDRHPIASDFLLPDCRESAFFQAEVSHEGLRPRQLVFWSAWVATLVKSPYTLSVFRLEAVERLAVAESANGFGSM